MPELQIDDSVDITRVVCPMTFVKVKAALDALETGQVLAVRLNSGEPVQNIPRSVKEEGHQILRLHSHDDGTFSLIIKKQED